MRSRRQTRHSCLKSSLTRQSSIRMSLSRLVMTAMDMAVSMKTLELVAVGAGIAVNSTQITKKWVAFKMQRTQRRRLLMSLNLKMYRTSKSMRPPNARKLSKSSRKVRLDAIVLRLTSLICKATSKRRQSSSIICRMTSRVSSRCSLKSRKTS